MTDHLGSARAVLRHSSGTTGTIEQRTDYYPFGHHKVVASGGINRYLYTGKELQADLGGQYDYGARLYDPLIGRWNVIDPLADNHYGVSGYAYVLDNPLRYIDPFGLDTLDAGTMTASQWSSADLGVDVLAIGQINLDYSPKVYNYGGDGSGSFTDKLMYGVDQVNQYLPTTHLLNSLTYAFSGQDIHGNRMSLASATLGAASVLPIGRIAGALSRTVGKVVAKGEVTVYRVFGGDARAQGFSWTTKNPTSIKNFRNAAGLPSGGASGATNTADFMIKGRVNSNNIIKSRSALPLDGNRGGLPELIIDPKNVRITDFKVLKP